VATRALKAAAAPRARAVTKPAPRKPQGAGTAAAKSSPKAAAKASPKAAGKTAGKTAGKASAKAVAKSPQGSARAARKVVGNVVPRVAEVVAVSDPTAQIEAVATELFIRNGYRGVSYLSIGKELGITHSNVHYYYRTKDALAEAVLRRVARETQAATGAIWNDPATTLVEKFVRMRDWTWQSYLRFNPDGRGARPWGLLSRFSMEADALTPVMRQLIRATLMRMEDEIGAAVRLAVAAKELGPDTPIDGVTLQIMSVMQQTGQLTRHSAVFSRLDELLKWTITSLLRAWGNSRKTGLVAWPPLPPIPASSQRGTV